MPEAALDLFDTFTRIDPPLFVDALTAKFPRNEVIETCQSLMASGQLKLDQDGYLVRAWA